MQSTIIFMCQLVGGSILTLSAIPQILRMYRNKSSNDMSIISQLMIITGIVLSEIYAIFQGGEALVITNTISLISSLISLFMILKYRKF